MRITYCLIFVLTNDINNDKNLKKKKDKQKLDWFNKFIQLLECFI